jgi:hypothetical protein
MMKSDLRIIIRTEQTIPQHKARDKELSAERREKSSVNINVNVAHIAVERRNASRQPWSTSDCDFPKRPVKSAKSSTKANSGSVGRKN